MTKTPEQHRRLAELHAQAARDAEARDDPERVLVRDLFAPDSSTRLFRKAACATAENL